MRLYYVLSVMLLFVCNAYTAIGQTSSDEIKFSYDASGNRKLRQLIHVTSLRNSNNSKKSDTSDLTKNKELSGLNNAVTITDFPNPVTDRLIVSVNSTGDTEGVIELFDVLGNIIKVQNITGKTNLVDFSNLSSGIYLIKVRTSNKTLEQKIIKQ